MVLSFSRAALSRHSLICVSSGETSTGPPTSSSIRRSDGTPPGIAPYLSLTARSLLTAAGPRGVTD
ncbi:hypothetical protein AUM95_22950, partial [Cronobacter sakazakii]